MIKKNKNSILDIKQNFDDRNKVKEQRIYDKIKKLYANYGIDILVMGDDELKRIYLYYSDKQDKLISDLKKSNEHASTFSDIDII